MEWNDDTLEKILYLHFGRCRVPDSQLHASRQRVRARLWAHAKISLAPGTSGMALGDATDRRPHLVLLPRPKKG